MTGTAATICASLSRLSPSTMSLLLTLVLLVLLVPPAPGTSRSYNGWRVLRVLPTSGEQLRLLEQHVHAMGPRSAELWRRLPVTDVFVRPDALDDLLSFLNERGIAAQVLVPDVGEEIRRERSVETPRSGNREPQMLRQYLRYGQMIQYLHALAKQYPGFVTVRKYGESYEGRPLKVIQISTGGNGRRPVILVDAGIHAREWIAPAMVLYVINQLVENPENAELITNVDWHIIPLLNPDGYEYSHDKDRMWRKTRSRTSTPGCYGTDPNRNFDYYWGVVGVSWNPCTETYAGPVPFSEVEAASLASYGLSLKGRMRLYVSVHSYGGVFIHPWGFSYQKPEDTPELMELGGLVANAVKSAGIRNFDVGNCFETLGELAAGGSDDWMKAVGGANYSFTLEMPVPSFTTPASDIAGYVVPTFEGFRAMGRFISSLFGCC